MFVPIFLLIMGILNLYAASKIGMLEGYDIAVLFKRWLAGINAAEEYSTIYLKATQRLETAILLFGGTLLAGIAVVSFRRARVRNRRITEILKYHREWRE